MVEVLTPHCSSYNVNLTDPGWPTVSYQCGLCPDTTTKIATSSIPLTRFAGTSSTSYSFEPVMTTNPTSSFSSSSTSSVAAVATGESSVATPFPVGTSTPAGTEAVSAAPKNQLSGQQIAIIATCTVVGIVLAALLLVTCAYRRRKKRLEESDARDLSKSLTDRGTAEFNNAPGDPYSPLISPSQSISSNRPPMTPPLRLRERRLLPSLLRPLSQSLLSGTALENKHDSASSFYSTSLKQFEHESAASSPAVSTGPRGKELASYPPAPFLDPTANKLEPREEIMQAFHRPKTSTGPTGPSPLVIVASEPDTSPALPRLQFPPSVSLTFPSREGSVIGSPISSTQGSPPRTQGHRRGGTASSPWSRGSGFSSFISAAFSPAGTRHNDETYIGPNTARVVSLNPFATDPRPSSPIRPPRPHDEPLQIPDLVAPDYPAVPAKSLSRPPSQPLFLSSSSSPGSGPRPSSPMGGMIGIARGSGGIDQVMNHAQGSISLQNLANQHVKRPRAGSADSWGSWEASAAAGRIFGVSFPSPGRASPGREGTPMTP